MRKPVGEWRVNGEAVCVTLLYCCLLLSLEAGLDAQWAARHSCVVSSLNSRVGFERREVSKCLTCYLLDDRKLHIFKIITAACMISVSSYLTRHADGLKYCFFLTSLPRGDANTASKRRILLGKGAERRRSLIRGHTTDKMLCHLNWHQSVLCKITGWCAVWGSALTAVAKSQARRQTHWTLGLVIKEMARARTVIFYLY